VSNSGSSQKCIQHKSQKTHFRRPELLPQAPTASKSPFPSCTSQLSRGRFARHRYITELSHLTRSVPLTVSAKPKLTSPQNPAGPTLTVLETCLPYQFLLSISCLQNLFRHRIRPPIPSSPSNDIKIQYTRTAFEVALAFPGLVTPGATSRPSVEIYRVPGVSAAR
jgi:hypothetical protein